MKTDQETFREILLHAQQALQRGERNTARRLAERAVQLDPNSEDAWLTLAAIASPRASVNYLQQALKINPNSLRAQKGMQWALARLPNQPPEGSASSSPESPASSSPESPASSSLESPAVSGPAEPNPQPNTGPEIQAETQIEEQGLLPPAAEQPSAPSKSRSRGSWARLRWPILALFLIALCAAAVWAFWPVSASPVLAFLQAPHATPGIAGILADIGRPSDTPTATATQPPTATLTPTPTSTATPVPTDTASPTATLAPTDTPSPTDSASPTPSETAAPAPTNTAAPAVSSVSSAGSGVRWIDVNLSKQMLYAYEGNTVVKSFLVSTGVRQFPTVTGQYHIYVKYLYTLMHGDGYYLPNVPYTMYFYKGYGIHGTYWHHNFGHPMSHGCVNMYTPDAEWMYYWASVGTLVNIHY
jgi:lipoprotein-anchoring transpeptidase ErfK/SrfK